MRAGTRVRFGRDIAIETNITSKPTQRSSGVLLHPTSLPGGRLGPEAYRFVDWLQAAGQSWWQMLPLGPPDAFGSPYNTGSAFAATTTLVADPRAPVSDAERADFRRRQAFWLDDYVTAVGDDALDDQIRFEREWSALRSYALARGVRLIGDVPIFASWDGIDVRAHPELFLRDVVAGAPPDYYNATGQLWGSALYDWPALRRTGYRWWVERLRRALEHVDVVRIDHFRGFVASWAVPRRHRTAARGRWRRGPGAALFSALAAELGGLPVIAEDLGRITPPVTRLRERLGLPGMRVLQFGFRGRADSPHRLENHSERSVVYTGTHDNDTALGWWRSLSADERAETGLDPAEPHWSLVRLAYTSRAQLAIVPAQDVLGLGSEARMNTPGRAEGNWSWRLQAGQLDAKLARRLRAEAEAAGRAQAARRRR
jgi:4-alpha-glucanotransferase